MPTALPFDLPYAHQSEEGSVDEGSSLECPSGALTDHRVVGRSMQLRVHKGHQFLQVLFNPPKPKPAVPVTSRDGAPINILQLAPIPLVG